MEKIINYAFIVLILFSLVSCSDYRIDSNAYESHEAMTDMDTYACTVVNRRMVKIKMNDPNNISGAILGSVAGGVIGNAFGSGGGRAAMTALGAIGGAAAGSAVQKSCQDSNKNIGYEYTVKLDINGKLKTVVQGQQITFKKGERVYLVCDRYKSKKSRLIPME